MAKKKRHNRVPKEVAEAVRNRADGHCEIMHYQSGCNGQAEHLHHRKLRSQGEEHTVENLVHICSNCHMWLHMHPKPAYEHGWLVKGMKNPAYIPFERRGVLVLLEHGGGWHEVTYEPLSI